MVDNERACDDAAETAGTTRVAGNARVTGRRRPPDATNTAGANGTSETVRYLGWKQSREEGPTVGGRDNQYLTFA